MANEKVLKTRIVNKHAELGTWNSSELVLKEGEIALAKVMVNQPDGTQAPTFVAKIGNNSTFATSPWLFAKASDVYSWAKASEKPGYTADEIARGESTVATDLKNAEDAIQALQSLVGSDKDVATLIREAIEALDVEDAAVANQFVTAVAEADGKITVTRRGLEAGDIPALEMSKITGLGDALDLKADKTQVAADIKVVTDDVAAKDAAMNTRVEALEAKPFDTYATKTEVADVDAKFADYTKTADLETELDLEARFAAKADESSVAERFAAINTELTTNVANAIADAKKAGTDAQGTIDAYKIANDAALAEVKATAEAARTETEVDDQIDAKISTYNTNTVAPLAERVTAAETAIGTEKTRAETAEGALSDRIKAVEDDYLTSTDKEALQTQINTIMNNPDAEGAINSINEFTQYIADHGEIADGFRADINKNKEDIAANAAAIAAINDEEAGILATANAYADSLAGNYDPAGSAEDALEAATGIATTKAGEALASAKSYTDQKTQANSDAIDGVASDLAEYETANNTRVGNIETDVASYKESNNTRVKAVEDDLAGYKTTNDAAVEAAQDAADAAMTHSEGVASDLEAYETANDARVLAVETDLAGYKTTVADEIAGAKTYAEEKASAAQTAAEGYTDDEIAKVVETATALAATVDQNKTDAAAATKKVADDLAAEILRADAAEKAAAALGQQGITDAAAALAYAKGLETGAIKTNADNIAANGAKIANIEGTYARVKDDKLVYGQGENEMVIVFDCGGAE